MDVELVTDQIIRVGGTLGAAGLHGSGVQGKFQEVKRSEFAVLMTTWTR